MSAARLTGLVVALVVAASPLCAQTLDQRVTSAVRWTGHERAADIASWVTALAAIGLDTRASLQSSAPRHALIRQGERTAAVYGAVFAAKTLVHRSRPCAPDCGADNPRFSFFSGHTAIACSTIGGPSLSVSIPLATGTGWLRVAAWKHWATDVTAGCAVGYLVRRVIH